MITQIKNSNVTERQMEDILRDISDRVGIEVYSLAKLYRKSSVGNRYILNTEHGMVDLGSIAHLLSYQRFRNKVADQLNIVINVFDGEEWRETSQGLLFVSEAVITSYKTSTVIMRNNLSEFINSFKDILDEFIDISVPLIKWTCKNKIREPFIHNGYVYIFLDEFQEWMKENKDYNYSKKTIASLLRGMNAQSQVLYVNNNGSDTSVHVFRVKKIM
jgi:hypothetical protein